MDPEQAIDRHIEPKLLDDFGPGVTRSVLAKGTLSYVMTAGGKAGKYRALVDSICGDRRVVEKWGEVMAAMQAREWTSLVREGS
jgi:hypothetical protein